MKICHITTVHSRYDTRIFLKECKSLTKQYDVSLIVADGLGNETKENIKIIDIGKRQSSRLKRMLIDSKKAFRKALELKAGIYHIHDPELLPIGARLKKIGKKVIYDSHEDTSVLIKTRKWIPAIIRNILSYIFGKYEKRTIKKFDAIISVTPLIVEKFKKINKNTYQITNYPNLSINKTNENLKRQDIAFAGNITHAYLLENVIDALSEINGVKLILAGTPVSKKYLNELKSLNGWKNVNYLGAISHDKVQNLYNKSLIGIACLGYIANAGFKEGTLGVLKLFEFMNAGMAVICTDSVIWKGIIENEKCGLCVNPYNINEIINAVQYLIDNPEIAIEMGENGRRAVENEYNWKTQEKILIDLYKKNLGHYEFIYILLQISYCISECNWSRLGCDKNKVDTIT